ncbi:MAG: NAD(+) synthase [Lachnospiraceae bacterium]|jgi:NAD+ synthase (glutamine-hydrolysing)|nr:NAD(+) synthase [Lachnospiraceae bacterium]
MKDGFIRVAAATPKIKVADPEYNRKQIMKLIEEGASQQVMVMVFPELCLTGYTCQDLFMQLPLIRKAKEELKLITEASKNIDMLIFVGLPWEMDGKLYNAAAAVCHGELLGIVPKKHLPNYSEFYELRNFCPGNDQAVENWDPDFQDWIYMGSHILFRCRETAGLVVGAEICEDLWVPCPPSISHAMAGATVIVNCSASNETTGKDGYRRNLVCGQSARLVCGYIYSNAGEGESTQDLVFGGQNIIAENGTCLAESKRFANDLVIADLDLERLNSERRRMSTFPSQKQAVAGGNFPGQKESGSLHGNYMEVMFSLEGEKKEASNENLWPLKRFIDRAPFVPHNKQEREKRCEEILSIQAMGLKKRLEHTGCVHAVVGLSGGLDSTLALLVTVRAFDLLKLPRNQIRCITMPCFGTTDRTYHNACQIAGQVGATLQEVVIKEAVSLHFRDIGQDPKLHDVTYENSQARERTQVLMDIANQINGMVIGTGDMSELALGWATYNGDHMSMYGVNGGVPKTLVRHLVQYFADTCGEKELAKVLEDVLDTPVSPELLPPENGKISQKTEDLVGPYELHDFFLYYVLRFGYMPSKIYRLAVQAFAGEYSQETVKKWLNVFYSRFFAQQFKRSCLPDGPKVGSVSVSPRGDLRLPSDACKRIWLEDLERIK